MKLDLSLPRVRDRFLAPWTAFMVAAERLLPLYASAWTSTSEPIQHLLDATDPVEQEKFVKIWKDELQVHLQGISITSALIAGVVTTSLTWSPTIELDERNKSTVVAIWYSSLLLSIGAIATATQLLVAVGRLCTYPDGTNKIRQLLGTCQNQTWTPRRMQLFILQIPVSLQNTSIFAFVLSLSIVVLESARKMSEENKIKVIIIFSLCLAYTVILYLMASTGLYYRISRI